MKQKKLVIRYERVVIAGVCLVIIISLTVGTVSGIIKRIKNKIPETDTPTAQITLPPVDNSKLVYLAPSAQELNLYEGMNTTEETQMRNVAESVKRHLTEMGISVQLSGAEYSLSDNVRIANELGVGMYVSIHSNAGGGKGTEAYYNASIPKSLELAASVYNAVAALTPTQDRGLKEVSNYELDELKNVTMPCVLLETEFHDNAETAQWIADNNDTLGYAVAKGIKEYYDTLPISANITNSSDE
jgi:hypothetical protein